MSRKNKLAIHNQHLVLKRALVTIAITLAFITMTEIPLPYINVAPLLLGMTHQKMQSFQMLSILSGGNLQQGSIMMIGLMPFIMIQLIMQVLQLGISSRLKALSETANGQKRLGKITKLLTLPVAFIQAGITIITLEKITNQQFITAKGLPLPFVVLTLMLIITASTYLAIWLSDLNTIYGLGNGINYLVSCSIVVSMIENLNINNSVMHKLMKIIGSHVVLVVGLCLLILVLYNAICIWYQSSTYRLKIQFTQLSSSVDKDGRLPFSLNIANVMPIIFAGILMNMIFTLNIWHNNNIQALVSFKTWGSIGLYTVILIAFTYLFTFIQFYPSKLNENLDRMNAYIIGVDPTLATISYFEKSLFLLATFNAIFYIVMVVIPMIIFKLLGLPEQYVLSASSIFILVATETDIRRQVVGLKAKEIHDKII